MLRLVRDSSDMVIESQLEHLQLLLRLSPEGG
jgi:hypothetical protein